MKGYILEIEPRRRLGLPTEVIAEAKWQAGDQVRVDVNREGRLTVTHLSDIIEKYNGAIPGLTESIQQPRPQEAE